MRLRYGFFDRTFMMKSLPFISVMTLFLLMLSAGTLPYNMETLSVADGLGSNNVYAVVQDSVGYMWFGTDNGLDRYDGKTIRHYTHHSDDDSSLASSVVNCLVYSDFFGLLVGTESGLSRYLPGKDAFEDFCSGRFRGENIRTVFERDSTLWIGTNSGLYTVRGGTGIDDSDRVRHYTIDNSGLNHDIVRAVQVDDDYVFVGTFDGVNRLNRRTGEWTGLNLKKEGIKLPQNNLVLSILQSPTDNGILYIGMQTGFCVLDKHSMEYSLHDRATYAEMCNNTVKTICPVKDDEVWLGSEEGVMIYRGGQFSAFGYDPDNLHSLPNNIVWQIYMDRNNIVWLATEGGVAYYDAGMPYFDKYDLTKASGNPYTGMNIFAAGLDWSGRIWLGSRFGLAYYMREDNSMKWIDLSNAVPGTYNFVRGLYIDSNDILWAGTAEGVICYDTRLDREIPIQSSMGGRLKYINVIRNMSEKSVLVCDVFGRVQIIDYDFDGRSRRFRHVSDTTFSVGEAVESMEFDGDALWFGTAGNGLIRYDPGSGQTDRYSSSDENTGGLLSDVIQCLYYDDRTSVLWIGSDKGLMSYDTETDTFSSISGLPAVKAVYTIAVDESGLLWFTTQSSAVCYDSLTESFKIFPLNHWLDDRRMICQASVTDNYDVFIFSLDSFMRLNRSDVRQRDRSAPLYLTDMRIDNRPFSSLFDVPVESVDRIRLKHDQNIISLCFSMLDYTAPDITSYTYMLKGYDDAWKTATGFQDYVEYTRLKPGHYTLFVKAVSSYGLKSANDLAIDIIIDVPWWHSRMAIFLYFVAATLAVWFITAMVRRRKVAEAELQHEKMEKEKNEALNSMKLSFFTNVSHDFKTPLSLIIGPVETLLETESEPERKKKLQIVRQNASRLLNLVNQILDFKKVEEQKMRLDLSSGDIVLTLSEICNSFREIADKRNISLHFESSEERLVMDFDKDKVDKIFVNLISNAVKFTPDGGQVVVSIARNERNELEIMVSDTGIGVPDKAIPHIFERFYRVEGHAGAEIKGSGIGLVIVKELVELHNGNIRVYSRENEGSSFIVTLPIVNEVTEAGESLPEEPEHGGDDSPAATVLVVEDNADMLSYLKSELSAHYRVLTADSAEEGLKFVNDEMPDLVISDIMLPGMSGVELCRRIKENLMTNHIPVLLLTARTAEEQVIEGYDAGADAYIGKPFNMKLLQSRVENIIRQREALRENLKRDTIDIDPVERSAPAEQFIKDVVAVIEENLDNPELDITLLCDRLTISYASFYRKVKSITGMNPNSFISEVRLKKAAQLLRIDGLSVTEVMYAVGYNHKSYFSKLFKNTFGVSPRAYAQQYKTQSNED